MKTFIKLIFSMTALLFVSFSLQIVAGIPAAFSAPALGAGSAALSGANLNAGLYKELWTGELIKHFRHENEFLSRIPSADQYVNNNAINLADMGADPEVLINNTTYPIASVQREDGDVSISLDKFDTKNTRITDDELYALPYDKPGSVITQHREVLEESTAEKAIHSLCAVSDSSDTPIVLTTGNSNGETHARKRLTTNDLIKLKRRMDDLKVPKKGRELVLCPAHVEDLLLVNQVFKDQYQKIETGKLINMYGFIISEFVGNPTFSNASGNKKAFGAAANPADDLYASVAYYNQRAVKAKGTAKMYHKKSEDDPEYRESKVGFRIYFIAIAKKNKGFAALVSDVV
jgi:hypothetical protein